MRKYQNLFVINSEKIVLFLLLGSLFIDIFNGYLVSKFGLSTPISQVYKMVLLISALWLFSFYRYNSKHLIFFLLSLFIMLINGLTIPFNAELYNTNLVADVMYTIKKFTLIIVYFGSLVLVTTTNYSEKTITRLYEIIFWVIFISLILSLFGFGETQYGENSDGISYGYKGYFFAGNELTSLYSLSYCFLLYRYLTSRSSVLVMLIAIICSGSIAILLATKTALISFIIITSLLPWLISSKSKSFVHIKNKITLLKVLLIPVVTITLYFLSSRISIIIDRFMFLYEQQGSTLEGFLLSGRNHRYDNLWNIYDKMNIVDILFGIGRESYVNFTYGSAHRYSAEMDFLDSFFSHGILGTIIIYSFWLYLIVKSYLAFKRSINPISSAQLLIIIILFANSFIAGHIFAASMVMVFFGFSTAYVIKSNRSSGMVI